MDQVDLADAQVNLADVQGNVLRGYRMLLVRHLLVRVANAGAARRFLGAVVSGDAATAPQITRAANWDAKPDTCLNVFISSSGLRALGLSEASWRTFPHEFRDGAAARNAKVGDIGDSAPNHWDDAFKNVDDLHLMWTVHAGDPANAVAAPPLLDAACARLESSWSAMGAFTVVGRYEGRAMDDDRVHFGYRDSISQPRFLVYPQLPAKPGETPRYPELPLVCGREDEQPHAPLGSVLLGHKTSFPDVSWRLPQPLALGYNGCFNAFRVMEQDVDGFEEFLRRAAAENSTGRPFVTEEWIAAKLMGRWRNGGPLVTFPGVVELVDEQGNKNPAMARDFDDLLNDFDYINDVDEFDDHAGHHCPMGAHIRRSNPRGAQIVQRSANHTRRLVRRGMPYGPPYDPTKPHDGIARGLLGNFLCGSLIAQYESIMYDWINLGLQDPRITGTSDPIMGANDPRNSRYEIPIKGAEPIVLTGFPRFVRTRGAAYLFGPSISALKFLAGLTR